MSLRRVAPLAIASLITACVPASEPVETTQQPVQTAEVQPALRATPDPTPAPTPTPSQAPGDILTYTGQLTQGGWLRGKLPPGKWTAQLGGEPVEVEADGSFFAAFDRDSVGTVVFKAVDANLIYVTKAITVSPRDWQIERVNIARRPGGASEAFMKIRQPELDAIWNSRLKETGAQGWTQNFIWPVKGRISGRFGSQRIYRGEPGSYHSGIDITTGTSGTPYVAPADGVVVLAVQGYSLEGNLLIIDHGNGLNSAFLHSSRLYVKQGDAVTQGQHIGDIGASGRATGPHLHWSIKWKNARLDPLLFTGPMSWALDSRDTHPDLLRMRRSRLISACLLAALLAPGTLVRTEPRPGFNWAPFYMVPVPVERVALGPFAAEAAWEIRSHNFWHGGYSALIATASDRLLAATDAGRFLSIELGDPLPLARGAGSIGDRPKTPGPPKKATDDIESLTINPATGKIWVGLEFTNTIERLGESLTFEGSIAPAEMKSWGYNTGPEAFARLDDGRFLVIEEKRKGWSGSRHRALLFAGDPLLGDSPRKLWFEGLEGYRPVDLAPAGAGQALVLYRRVALGFPSLFSTAIGLLDLDDLGEGNVVRPRLLTIFDGEVPQDNFEGMAVTENDNGRFVWLISDDNFMSYQRSLLLKLRWDRKPERQKARE